MKYIIYILFLLTLAACTRDAEITDVPGIDLCLPVRVVSEIEPGHALDTLEIWRTREDVEQWLEPVFDDVQLLFLEAGVVLRFEEIEWVEARKFYGRGASGCTVRQRFEDWYADNPTGHAVALVLSNAQAFNGCADGHSLVMRTCDPHVQDGLAMFRPDNLTQGEAAHLIGHELAHLFGMVHLPSVPDGKRGIAGAAKTNDMAWHRFTLQRVQEYARKVYWCDSCQERKN